MTIRAAGLPDLSRISEIQAASPEAAQWMPAGYLEHDCRVAVSEKNLIGFLVARQVAPGERELLNLAVDPAERRRGVARALLLDALTAWPGTWFLEVRASNRAAIQLYEWAGFRLVGRRGGYYVGPAEDAIVMRFFS